MKKHKPGRPKVKNLVKFKTVSIRSNLWDTLKLEADALKISTSALASKIIESRAERPLIKKNHSGEDSVEKNNKSREGFAVEKQNESTDWEEFK